MAQSKQTDSNQGQPKKLLLAVRLLRNTALIVLCGALLAGLIQGLIIFSHRLDPRLSDPVQFVTGNLLNALIFIAIVAQVFIYRKQWHVMERQWKEANRQAELSTTQMEIMVFSECAYMTLGDWSIPTLAGHQLVVTGKLVNAGRTPALDLKRKIQIAIGEGSPPHGWGPFDWDSLPDDGTGGILIAANKDVNFTNEPLEIDDDLIAEINSGKQMICIDGQCRYFDLMGGKQIYRFGVTLELGPPARAVIRYQNHEREKADPN